jgi:DNA polymerase III epsilon subunit-like protein
LVDKPAFVGVANQIFSFIESAPLIIAHNLSFDKDALEIEAERLGRTIAWPPGLCSVEQSLHLKSKRLTLKKLHAELFGKEFEGAHRAKTDVQALVRCCVELFKRGVL